MNAAEFYSAFYEGWSSVGTTVLVKQLAGPTLKWKVQIPAASITFAFATNAKTAGLLPHLPGEFRLRISWAHKVEAARKVDEVSWFQYTHDDDNLTFATLQRAALEKFLAQQNKEPLRSIYGYANDPNCVPRANFEEFAYYFDALDARAWGVWYATLLPTWVSRFNEYPESLNDWCWRVLWSDKPKSPD
jgi:hypothetical protein